MDLKEIALNKSQKRHPWELARIKVITHFIHCLQRTGKKTTSILDIGSGDTYLIKELSKQFSDAFFYAVDIGYDDEYVRTANKEFEKEQVKIKVFNNFAAAEQSMRHPADLVLLLDVIEHVPDDVQLLKELNASSAIDQETIFLITVPAFQKLFSAHDVFLGHYRRYNNKLLRKNISNAGLQVLGIGYFFTFLLLPRYLQVITEKKDKSGIGVEGIGNWEGGPGISKALITALRVDFSISVFLRKLGIKLPGLSNYAICKRSA